MHGSEPQPKVPLFVQISSLVQNKIPEQTAISREQQESLECFYFHAWDKPLQSKCLLWLAWQVLMDGK